jgi:hypothetical protein
LSPLTQIQRVDILEDAGESLSPDIDIGQIEGAFTMGLGYWLLEHLEFDPKTGALLTNRAWVSNFDFITFCSRPTAYSSILQIILKRKILSVHFSVPHCQNSHFSITHSDCRSRNDKVGNQGSYNESMNSYLLALYDISYSPAYKMTLHIR